MGTETGQAPGWAGKPDHNQTFIEKYGKSEISFGLAGRTIITIVTMSIGAWLTCAISSGERDSMIKLLAPAAALYLVVILPIVLKAVWRPNEARVRDRQDTSHRQANR